MPCRSRRGPPPAWKSSSRCSTCQPSAASTSKAAALPPKAAHAAPELLASGLGCGSGGWLGMTVSVDGAGRRRAFAMNREVADGRMLAAEWTLRIAFELHLADAHAERVVRHEPPDERFANPEEELHGFGRLHDSDHAWEHAQDTGLASGGHEARWRRRRIEAAVAGSLVGREDRRHALELEDRAVDVGLAGEIAGVVDEVARVEVVRSVDDQVVVLND